MIPVHSVLCAPLQLLLHCVRCRYNCYQGHGGIDLEQIERIEGLDACKEECNKRRATCEGVVMVSGEHAEDGARTCYLRRSIDLEACLSKTRYSTHTAAQSS